MVLLALALRPTKGEAGRSYDVDSGLMQVEAGVGDLQARDLEQAAGADLDRVQAAYQVALPEVEESSQDGEMRRQVVVLPEVGLEQGWMVGQMVENLCRGEPVTLKLAFESAHAISSFLDVLRIEQ